MTLLSGVVIRAELLVGPSRTVGAKQFELGLTVAKSTVEYEFGGDGGFLYPRDGSGEVERMTVSAYGTYGVTDRLDFFLAAAYVTKAEADWWSDDTGRVFGGGVRSEVWKQGNTSLGVYAQVTHRQEDYGERGGLWQKYRTGWEGLRIYQGTVGLSIKLTEALVGTVLRMDQDALSFYGGLEVVPYSDGRVESDPSSFAKFFEEDVKVERSEMINIKLGANYRFDNGFIASVDLTLVGEQTIGLSVESRL